MSTVFLYSPYWSSFGGGEKYSLSLAITLSKLPGVSVTVLACEETIDKKTLENFFGLDLSAVNLLNIGS